MTYYKDNRQRDYDVLKAVEEYIAEKGWPPNMQHLCDKMDCSKSKIRGALDSLQAAGYVVHQYPNSRTIRLLKSSADFRRERFIA